jgi:hypothetical protein
MKQLVSDVQRINEDLKLDYKKLENQLVHIRKEVATITQGSFQGSFQFIPSSAQSSAQIIPSSLSSDVLDENSIITNQTLENVPSIIAMENAGN